MEGTLPECADLGRVIGMVLYLEQLINTDLNTAWDFFSSPANLQKITPRNMGFEIQTELDERAMYEGQIIDYVVRPIFGIPIKWRTEIRNVNEPFSFTDVQLKGPYAFWEHTHVFEKVENGILVKDYVKYKLPLGFLGRMVHALFVSARLAHIFDHRARILEAFFNKMDD